MCAQRRTASRGGDRNHAHAEPRACHPKIKLDASSRPRNAKGFRCVDKILYRRKLFIYKHLRRYRGGGRGRG